MATESISIEVDADAARAFAGASPEERRKLQLLLSLRLRELTEGERRPLKDIMNEIGSHAETQGLTSEIVESLLNDE